jgi:protease secretion system outer membrane protein
VLLALLASGSAGAVSLQQAYEAALKNDPQYRMNFYENEAAKENRMLGRSNLLPQVSASFGVSRNVADTEHLLPRSTPRSVITRAISAARRGCSCASRS